MLFDTSQGETVSVSQGKSGRKTPFHSDKHLDSHSKLNVHLPFSICSPNTCFTVAPNTQGALLCHEATSPLNSLFCGLGLEPMHMLNKNSGP